MAKQFFIRNASLHDSDSDSWVQLSGAEFYAFVNSPQSKGRFFIDMEDYVLEASEDQFRRHKSQQDHSDYLNRFKKAYVFVSLYEMEQRNGYNGEDVIPDETQNTEQSALEKVLSSQLKVAISLLNDEEQWVISELYLSAKKKTLRQVSDESGIPVMTLHGRKESAKKKLKKFMENKK